MIRTVLIRAGFIVLALVVVAGCHKAAPTTSLVDAGAPPPTTTTPEHLTFAGAAGWTGGRA
ncbi:MAG TPA: hypothetical protein VGO62_07885, partial [Myxococcota bacterium]